MKYQMIHAALQCVHASGMASLLAPVMGGLGCILTLHHVRPYVAHEFHPNRILEITPKFLSNLIIALKKSGYVFVSMDEVAEILQSGRRRDGKRFIAITLDDGYQDNLQYAVPIFRTHNVPYCIYIPTAYPSGNGILWWLALEEIIRIQPGIQFLRAGHSVELPTLTLKEKNHAWRTLYRYIKTLQEPEVWQLTRQIAHHAGYDLQGLTKSMIMSWPQLNDLARDPWCTLGAHTITHSALSRSSEQWVRQELDGSTKMLEQFIGVRTWHLAYPYGSLHDVAGREYQLALDAGFLTAVTTRPGVITPAHAEHMTALPRISVNGLFQNVMEMQTLCSGFPVRVLGN